MAHGLYQVPALRGISATFRVYCAVSRSQSLFHLFACLHAPRGCQMRADAQSGVGSSKLNGADSTRGRTLLVLDDEMIMLH